MGKYDDEAKSANWGFGHKKHGDKRHRTTVTYSGHQLPRWGDPRGQDLSARGGQLLGVEQSSTTTALVQNDETVTKKVVSYEETYNQIETLTSLDLMQRFSASAQGEFSGIGGSVTTTTEMRAHTEVGTQKYDLKKREVMLDTSARICYPGPVYRDDFDDNGQIAGRTLVQEGEIWLVDQPSRGCPHRYAR